MSGIVKRFALAHNDGIVSLPIGAEILAFGWQGGPHYHIWALIDPAVGDAVEDRHLLVVLEDGIINHPIGKIVALDAILAETPGEKMRMLFEIMP